jgi:hypothetical protein
MHTREQINNIVKEIMIKEGLNSPRQVFERYPDLGRAYNSASTTSKDEE